MSSGTRNRTDTSSVRCCPDHCSVQIKSGCAPVEHHREMMPSVECQRSGLKYRVVRLRVARCRFVLFKLKRGRVGKSSRLGACWLSIGLRRRRLNRSIELQVRLVRCIADFDPLRRVEFKHVLVPVESVPLDPAFKPGRVESPEGLLRQLQIISVTAQLKNVSRTS